MSGQPPDCRRSDSAIPYVQGELSPAESDTFSAHLAGCASCARSIGEAREFLAHVSASLPDEPCADLAPRILAQVMPGSWERKRLSVPWPLGWVAAACVLAGISGVLHWALRKPPQASPVFQDVMTAGVPDSARAREKALDWLASAQEPDGTWDPARWDGHGNFSVAVTGLSLMALLDREELPETRAHAGSVDRAATALLRVQDGAGHFGPSGTGALYNHAIATAALLELHAARPGPALKGAAGRAVRCLLSAQTPAGGWGYAEGGADEPNTAMSVWPLAALARARAAGIPGVEGALARGTGWLKGVMDETGRVGYRRVRDFPYGEPTLVAMGAFALLSIDGEGIARDARLSEALRTLVSAPEASGRDVDYYRSFFLSRVLVTTAAEGGGDTGRKLARDLSARQVAEGSFAGSWAPADRWSAAGGRVYATAMAAMALSRGMKAR